MADNTKDLEGAHTILSKAELKEMVALPMLLNALVRKRYLFTLSAHIHRDKVYFLCHLHGNRPVTHHT